MRRMSIRRRAGGILILLAAGALLTAQAKLSLKDVVRGNIDAAGGQAKLAQVTSLSFRTGAARTFVSAAGDLKIVTGKDPVVTEAVLVAGGKVLRNSFGMKSEVTGPQATVYRTMAELYAGLFSLARFEGRLELVGLKSFGPETFYHLRPKGPAGPVGVHFYLRADDFLLRRVVFTGTTPEGDKYEVNYDFAPFEEVEGVRLPLSWFASQVGTRGALTEISEVKVNAPLAKGFFAKAETNIGRVEASPGQLKGNVLDWSSSPFGLTIVTNWARRDVDAAGLKTGDRLVLLIGEDELGLTFYAQSSELPPREELAKLGRLLAPMPRGGEAFAIQVIGGEGEALAARLAPLTPLSVKKTAN